MLTKSTAVANAISEFYTPTRSFQSYQNHPGGNEHEIRAGDAMGRGGTPILKAKRVMQVRDFFFFFF